MNDKKYLKLLCSHPEDPEPTFKLTVLSYKFGGRLVLSSGDECALVGTEPRAGRRRVEVRRGKDGEQFVVWGTAHGIR